MEKEQLKKEFYTSPEVKVVEIKVRQVLCASNGMVGNMEFDGDGGGNFN